MIDIKDISGKILKSVIETADCKKYEELMSLCYISLSWDDENNIQLPAGSYIEYNGEKYRLIEPYDPSFKDESTFQYTPKFYDKIALWSKKPLFLVTDTGEETDWSMTAYPGQFMEAVVRALSKYTGETFTYSVDASIAQSTMEYISFQNKNIFDGLTEIANKWNVEWWVEGNIIHLSKCQYGEPITLEVGKNVGIPTVTSNKDGYFTRFYAFGSTKNITQEYDDGGFTNGLVNKRLTLNPSLYPGGYMDIRPGLHPEEVFVKTLIFDNIFPSSKLVISGVRAELKDYIDSDGNKIQVGESEGEPLYKQYAIWYFKIDGFSFNNSTYDKDDNPEGMLLSGLDLSVIFESGQLNGRDFKLTYHEETQEYEINFVEESGSIIVPGTVSLIPADGDNIVLYNIRMPEEYVSSSQEELAEALLSEMERYKRNMNSYSFPSYPVSFYEENLDMKVGQSVSFIYGGNNLSTRVLKVEKQLDYPIEQTITIGEEKIKGNTQEIKEEVIYANQNIDVVKALADLNKAITDGYGRVQQLIMQSLSQYKGIWTLDQNGFPNDPSKWTIKTDYTAISAKDFIAFADGGEYASGLPVADTVTYGLVKVDGTTVRINASGQLEADAGGGIDFEVGTGLQMSSSSVLSVKYGTTAGTACQGNDSRLHTHNNKSYLDVINQNLGTSHSPTFKAMTLSEWTIDSVGGDLNLRHLGQLAAYFSGANNGNFVAKGTMIAEGDVIAYSDGGSYSSGLPVADSSTYGLVRYDGTTIGKNSSGQLYVINAGSGGGSNINVIDSLTSQSKTDALSANQGYIIDQRLKNIRWATPDGTDYVRVYLGSEYRDLSKNGHSHAWSTITSKPSWIGSTKPSYSWSEITNKPTVISSITYSTSGSGNAVTNVTASGNTVYVTKGTISGGSSWNGGTITNGITISNRGKVGISISTGTPFVKFGSNWKIQSESDLNFYYGSGGALAYFSGSNKGNLWIAGTLSQNSDMRLKTVLSPITDVLKAISTFDVFRYRYNNDEKGRVRIGMSAQQVKIYYPELVFTETDGYYSMDYVSMSAVLVGGVKELYTRFLPVENKVKILESRVQNLQLRLDNAYREIFELKQRMGGAA